MIKIKERVFRFKHFAVSHSSAAMKVGTDGVLLGAWAPISDDCRRIWDVGSGSGVIALMMAQRCGQANIDAIEIDPDAVREMSRNFQASPWAARINAVEGDICEFADSLKRPDLIVSNPPFFANSLTAPDKLRSQARHEATLGFESLIEIAAKYLTENGSLAMISPADRRKDIEWQAALRRLYVRQLIEVVTAPSRTPARILWLLGRRAGAMKTDRICLREPSGEYSDIYKSLTQEFYIHL